MLTLDTSKIKLAAIISICRYVYVEYLHNDVYDLTLGIVNGYVVMTALLHVLRIPWYLILLVLTSRFVYRKHFGEDVVNVGNHVYNVIAFFVMTLVIFSLSYNR